MKRILPLLASLVVLGGQVLSAAPARPNILIILVDDLGYGDLGVHGCRDIPTPHIDRLAANGVRFTAAYASGSFCTPTRAALMSGRYQQRTGNEDLSNVTGPLPQGVKTLPERLKAAGYVTGMAGKWHLGETAGFRPTERGFDEFCGILGGGSRNLPGPAGGKKGAARLMIVRGVTPEPATEYLQDAWGREAVGFIEKHRGEPWFFYLAFNAVHAPVEATEKYLQRFTHLEDRTRRNYAAMLSAVDDAVGAVVARLAGTGQLDRTLIFFSSDNGGPTTRNAVNGSRNTPLRGSKCETFEGGIRVPLLAQWPAALKPGAYHQPVITMDVTATALALASAEAVDVEGVNLLPFVAGEKNGPPHDALFWRCRMRSNNYGARQGDWKFVHSTEGGQDPGPGQTPARDMLFNLAEDLSERTDLAAQHPARLAALKELYEQWSNSVDADCRKLGIDPGRIPADTAVPRKPAAKKRIEPKAKP